MSLLLLQYKAGSRSARALAEALNLRRLRPDTQRYNGGHRGSRDTIINWGCNNFNTNHPAIEKVYNAPHYVSLATNKLTFFQHLEGNPDVRTVPFTTDREVAKLWDKGIARTLLRASEGRGIELFVRPDEPVPAPLFTQYIPKKREFRVHVAFGSVIDSQRKIADPSREVSTWSIRNHSNGFIFVRNSGTPTQASLDMAVATCSALGLDFGAVDLIENKSGTYILEVNTAPGLEGQTLESYRSAFEQEIRNRH